MGGEEKAPCSSPNSQGKEMFFPLPRAGRKGAARPGQDVTCAGEGAVPLVPIKDVCVGQCDWGTFS